MTLGEVAMEVLPRHSTWEGELVKAPDHFQAMVRAYRARSAQLEALQGAQAVGATVRSKVVVEGRLPTMYPENWVKGKYYEEEWEEGPYSKRAYLEDEYQEMDPTFGRTNAFKLLGFSTMGPHISYFFRGIRRCPNEPLFVP